MIKIRYAYPICVSDMNTRYEYPICVPDMHIGVAYPARMSGVDNRVAHKMHTSDAHIGYEYRLCKLGMHNEYAYRICTSPICIWDMHIGIGRACRIRKSMHMRNMLGWNFNSTRASRGVLFVCSRVRHHVDQMLSI